MTSVSLPNGKNREPLCWKPCSVLVVGPETDPSLIAGANLGGSVPPSTDGTGIVVDGRMRFSTSAVCFHDPGEDRFVVLASVTALGPFLKLEAAPWMAKTDRNLPLQPLLGQGLAPTTELFVIFDPSKAEETRSASLAAIVPVPQAEAAFSRIQSVIGLPTTKGGEGKANTEKEADICWKLPTVGTLAFAVLHVNQVKNLGASSQSSAPSAGWRRIGESGTAAAALDVEDAARLALAPRTFSHLVGRPLELFSSPFCSLKPSLFLNSQLHGLLAGVSPEGSMLIVDARMMGGSEGGAIVLDGDGGDLIAFACPVLRQTNNWRTTLGAAVTLPAIAVAIHNFFPLKLRHALLGPRLTEALWGPRVFWKHLELAKAGGRREVLQTRSPLHCSAEEQLARSVARVAASTCYLSLDPRVGRVRALKLSARGHWLTSADLLSSLPSSGNSLAPSSFDVCYCCPGGSGGSGGSSSSSSSSCSSSRHPRCYEGRARATLLHVFSGLAPGLLVLQLEPAEKESGLLDVEPLFWAIPPVATLARPDREYLVPTLHASRSLGVPVVEDYGCFQAGSRVLSLGLDLAMDGSPSHRVSSGRIKKVHSCTHAWRPVAFECDFEAPAGKTAVLISTKAPYPIVGFLASGDEEITAPTARWVAATSYEAFPVVRLLTSVSSGAISVAQRELTKVDDAFAEQTEAGLERLLWKLSTGSPPQRSLTAAL